MLSSCLLNKEAESFCDLVRFYGISKLEGALLCFGSFLARTQLMSTFARSAVQRQQIHRANWSVLGSRKTHYTCVSVCLLLIFRPMALTPVTVLDALLKLFTLQGCPQNKSKGANWANREICWKNTLPTEILKSHSSECQSHPYSQTFQYLLLLITHFTRTV